MNQFVSLSNKTLSEGICGWFGSIGNIDIPEHNISSMTSALNTSIKTANCTGENYGCVSTADIYTIDHHLTVAIIGSPRWPTAERNETSRIRGKASVLANRYLEYGINCLSEIKGSFAFLIIDHKNEKVLAGIDKMGQHPLYYADQQQGVVFGTAVRTVLAHSAVDKNLTNQGIYNYLYFHMIPSPTSIYEGLKKVPAGHYLQYEQGKLLIKRYWIPNYNDSSGGSIHDLSIELIEILKRSVMRADNKTMNVGTFLSGGLDSSSVTGMLSEIRKAKAYSIGFSATGYDEMDYARISARHFHVELEEYYVTPEDVVETLPLIAASYDEPFGNSSALPAYFCARKAAMDGCERLLAGDGGDELFAGNERYAKQALFQAYNLIPRRLRKDILEPVVFALPDSLPLLKKSKSYIKQANIPLPDRLQSYNFMNRYDSEDVFSDEFIDEVSIENPLDIQHSIYNAPDNTSHLKRMLYLDWQLTLADNDLCKVGQMCALAGIEVVYPMLDDELIEFSCKIPDRWKLKGQDLRYFYKQAMQGWLPQETIRKKKQGFGLPFGVWMKTYRPLQELAYDTLLKLKNRDYFKGEFIDQTIELHRNGHAAYYGELIWILMVLELWLSKQQGFKG